MFSKFIRCCAVILMILCFTKSKIVENSLPNNGREIQSRNWVFKDYQPLWYHALVFLICIVLFIRKPFDLGTARFQSDYFHILAMVGDLIIKTLFGTCLCLLFVPIVLPVYLLLWISKKLVECLMHIQYLNSIVKSTGADIMLAFNPEVSQPFITAALKFEGDVNMSFIKETISRVLLNYEEIDGRKPFRKLMQTHNAYYGFLFWKDCEHFSIENHVKLVNLTDLYPDLDDTDTLNQYLKCTDKLVCQYVTDVGFSRLPPDQPQWQIHFLTKDNEDGYTLYFKLHHAIGDGMSLIRLLMEHLADNPVKVSLLQELPQSFLKRFLYSLWSISFLPFSIKFMMLDRCSNPLHGKKLSGNKLSVTSEPIPLDQIKRIKNQTKTTVTEVLFSCLSYAIACHFKRKSSSVKKVNIIFPGGFHNSNTPITMSNMFTINICSLPTIQDKELQMEHKELKDKGPAIVRIFKIKESLDALKRGPIVQAIYILFNLLVNVLPISLTPLLLNFKGITLACSNVPGPQHEIFVLKRKMTAMRFWVPDREPNGFGVGFMSYNGQVRLGLSGDNALIDSRRDLEMMVDDFGKQMLNLSDELNLNKPTISEKANQ